MTGRREPSAAVERATVARREPSATVERAMIARRAAIALLLSASGCGGIDPCAGEAGACLGLHFRGSIGAVTAIELDLRGPVVRRLQAPIRRLFFDVSPM